MVSLGVLPYVVQQHHQHSNQVLQTVTAAVGLMTMNDDGHGHDDGTAPLWVLQPGRMGSMEVKY